jgi:hypothetical protein
MNPRRFAARKDFGKFESFAACGCKALKLTKIALMLGKILRYLLYILHIIRFEKMEVTQKLARGYGNSHFGCTLWIGLGCIQFGRNRVHFADRDLCKGVFLR